MSFKIRNLTKKFGALTAINDLSIDFGTGLITGLIGPNGAGKSTLINLLSGSFPPSSGEMLLNGKQLNGMPKHKISLEGIARTYQNVRLFDHLTVLENLEVCFYPLHRGNVWREVFQPGFKRRQDAERRDHCMAILESCGIADYANMDARLLAYGRQRILEIARALVRDPPVLLLDEPAAGLNHHETEDLKNRLALLRRPGRVLIVVEHDMDLVMSLCDHIHVLNFGSLLFSGTPAEVQADEKVQEAYLGIADEHAEIRTLAEARHAEGRLRSHDSPQWH